MNIIGIAIGITGLLLLGMFLWMLALSMRRKRMEQERKERELAYRKAMERDRKQEREDRIYKAEHDDIPSILYLAKEAERTRPKEALHWYTKAAKLDNVTGMYGIIRLSNRMNQDMVLREQSRFWQICISAIEGSLEHKFEMGNALFYGRGTERDIPKAIEVLESAANFNHVNSLLFLGDWWISDLNPQQEPAYALELFRRAAALKSNEGRMKLGLCYIKGIGVAANHELGCYWLERACERGYLEAMYRAGEAWMDYRPNGSAIAYIWLFLATQLGYAPAKTLRDRVALNLGVDTVVGLQALCKPIIKKIRENKVGKHSIIKALNKLYKRTVPLQEQDVTKHDVVQEPELDLEPDFTKFSNQVLESEQTQSPMQQGHSQESHQQGSNQANDDDVGIELATDSEDKPEKLDFRQF